MAATRSQKPVAGERPEDLNKTPSNFQKELVKIAQKNKSKKNRVCKTGTCLEADRDNKRCPRVTFCGGAAFTFCGKGPIQNR